jgi:hypothetical protein
MRVVNIKKHEESHARKITIQGFRMVDIEAFGNTDLCIVMLMLRQLWSNAKNRTCAVIGFEVQFTSNVKQPVRGNRGLEKAREHTPRSKQLAELSR